MGLTSQKVLSLAVVVSATLFALTVWMWPRLAGRGAPALLGRIAVLLTTQLSILAAGGIWANGYFGFYSSWNDLFGTDRTLGVVTDHSAGPSRRIEVDGIRSVGVTGGGAPDRAGRIEKVRIHGRTTGIAAPAYVYLPPQYFHRSRVRSTFPAAVVLTGYPGTAANLITRLRYPQTATTHIRAGAMRPLILVMMRPTVAPPRDTECVDVPGGPQAETFFTRDLRAAVASRYRVGRRARNWGVIGNSTGGYCAVKMAMRHPGDFSVGVGLSGSYRAPRDPTTGDLFGGDTRLERENDLMWREDHLPMPPVSVLVAISRSGEHSGFAAARTFIGKVRPPIHVASIVLGSGGHNFHTWNREIPPALDWLSLRLSPG